MQRPGVLSLRSIVLAAQRGYIPTLAFRVRLHCAADPLLRTSISGKHEQ
jgi:hypothetical protein